MKKFIIFFVIISLIPYPVLAIKTIFGDIATLEVLICELFDFALIIGGAVGAIMLIYGGIRYITSSGNPQGIAEAKNIIFITLSALAVLILARVIFSTVIGKHICPFAGFSFP